MHFILIKHREKYNKFRSELKRLTFMLKLTLSPYHFTKRHDETYTKHEQRNRPDFRQVFPNRQPRPQLLSPRRSEHHFSLKQALREHLQSAGEDCRQGFPHTRHFPPVSDQALRLGKSLFRTEWPNQPNDLLQRKHSQKNRLQLDSRPALLIAVRNCRRHHRKCWSKNARRWFYHWEFAGQEHRATRGDSEVHERDKCFRKKENRGQKWWRGCQDQGRSHGWSRRPGEVLARKRSGRHEKQHHWRVVAQHRSHVEVDWSEPSRNTGVHAEGFATGDHGSDE